MSINIDPVDKVRYVYPVDHYQDNTDPHGETLYQTNLIVTGLLSGNEIQFDEMVLSGTAVARHIDYTNIVGDRLQAHALDEFIADIQTALLSGNRVTVLGQSVWSGDIVLEAGATIDGRDVSADAIVLNDHVNDFDNPHQLTADQVSGIPKYVDSVLSGNLQVASGVTVDEVDVSELEQFIDGSTVSNSLHYHHRNWLEDNLKQFIAPEFANTIFSGNDYRKFQGDWDNFHNSYVFSGTETEHTMQMFTKVPLSNHASQLNNLKFYYKGDDGGKISCILYDSDGVQASQSGGIDLLTPDIGWTQETISSISGQFTSGTEIMVKTILETWSGGSIQVGEMILDYNDNH